MDMIRQDTAKQYRSIRRILAEGRSDPYDEAQPKDRILTWLIVVLGVLVFIALFSGCAQAQELTASWYSVESLKAEGTWKHSQGVMANGHIFSNNNLTCATRLYPLGAYLLVSKGNKRVRVLVSDRIGKRFAKTRIDLSKSAFLKISTLKQGLIRVKVEVLNGKIKGQNEFEKREKGGKLTMKQAILANCYMCNGYEESNTDCGGQNTCALYLYSPYGRKKGLHSNAKLSKAVA